MNSKRYVYEYEDYENGDKDGKTMAQEILSDVENGCPEEIVVGCWGESYENEVQPIIDMFVNNKEKFDSLKSLFIGDMDYEECEVSWISQGDYGKLWEAFPQLEKLTIKGSNDLTLGSISHENLKSLEIICGGLPKSVIHEIAQAKLPALETLNLYLGVENYGFDGSAQDVKTLIDHAASFQSLKNLGLGDSEIQDEVTKAVMESEVVSKLEVLELSNGTLSDQGAQYILDHKDKLMGLKKLDLHYHFLSDEMMAKIKALGIPADLESQNKNDERYGNYPMLTE